MAGTYNFTGDAAFEVGATLDRAIVWKDANGNVMNLTGYTAFMQVRLKPGAPVLLDLSTSNVGIVIEALSGITRLTQTRVQTAAWTWKKGLYDLVLLNASGVAERGLSGEVEASPAITVVP